MNMKIKLQGIGIIKDSEIELNGLTVITGDNNSGKTTVGKVVYSLFDAVSDLFEKAEADKNNYAWKTIREIRSSLEPMSLCFKLYPKSSHLFILFTNALFDFKNDAIRFAKNLYEDINDFYEIGIKTLDESIKEELLYLIKQRFKKRNNKIFTVEEYIYDQLDYSLEILEELFKNLENDPQLIDYARENIYQTLNIEFMGQIQPVKVNVEKSSIVAENFNKIYFCFDIINNKIVNNNNPVYFESPIKKAFFVDNPFVLDLGDCTYATGLNANNGNFINRSRISPHEVKLNNFLEKEDTTIFETTILEKEYTKINTKINEVISGDFEFSRNGDYYVEKGVKLRFSNLATGSKLFSILKLLINKGALNESTVLVLDEPEAHLHPAWQNKFAEIIVMLVKELNVKILLTSHSPNFVLAIEAFMRKYEINDKTNFYQTRFLEDGFAEYINVNNDMGRIYSDYVQYLTEVKILRNKYMHGLGDNDD